MSSRKNRNPEEQARRAKIRELLQESNISSMADIQDLFRETIAEFMENGLDAELDNQLQFWSILCSFSIFIFFTHPFARISVKRGKRSLQLK